MAIVDTDALARHQRASLAQGTLEFQRCLACGKPWLPVRERCPSCLSTEWQWQAAGGGGRIVSWVVYHTAYDPAWAGRVPYNVALVELDEGPRLITNILAENDALTPHAPVRLVVQQEGDAPVARFALAQAGAASPAA